MKHTRPTDGDQGRPRDGSGGEGNTDEQERRNRVADFEAVLRGPVVGLIGIGPDGKARDLAPLPPLGELRKTGLESVAESLWQNIIRIHHFCWFPYDVFEYATKRYHLLAQVCLRETGTIDPPEDRGVAERVSDMLKKEEEAWISGSLEPTSSPGPPFTSQVAGMAAFQLQTGREPIPAFYGSIVIQSWSMFEGFAEDLWVAAVDKLPNKLAPLSGKPRLKHKQTEGKSKGGGPDSKGRTGPSISVQDLQRYGFDVSGSMGKILRDNDEVRFRRLGDIREAFHRAFDEQPNGIDDILDDEWLQYLSAVRNVLVHSSGKVDADFLNQTHGFSKVPIIKELERGDAFPLTGRLTAELAKHAALLSIALLKSVHSWIRGHQKPEVK